MNTPHNYTLTKEQLLTDLYRAYLDARKHKRSKPYQMKYELHLEDNLLELRDSLLNRTYKPLPSKCFVISDPTTREVFAADFRDRIVHHLYYNYTYRMFDSTFIDDCYSCRKEKGTLYGVKRMYQHIKEESDGYTKPCYVLKMDISGYFMNIDRHRLCEICIRTLHTLAEKATGRKGKTWRETVDIEFLDYLTREIILLNPIEGCRIYGGRSDWQRLPEKRSLFHSEEGCGLPIGNLTSQLFSNVYLNMLDQWMTREMHCQHYGRYVDDFYVVSTDRRWLARLVDKTADFAYKELGLTLNSQKTQIYDCRHGVPFLGYFLKPGRIYVSNRTWKRMKRKTMVTVSHANPERVRSTVNSYLGLLRHTRSYEYTGRFFNGIQRIMDLGSITPFTRKLVLSEKTLDTMLLNKMMRMIKDEHYDLCYEDIDLWCHEYVDKYIE